ncbi:MAG TPA: 16S rRNA (uracil(1498)-N(3))-methyltransferase [Nocardioidaceae bacterium]|nr:16S rRNA (uracil(1498)-N(3))-methyltransferase [Nocardioidaceae bacterium]
MSVPVFLVESSSLQDELIALGGSEGRHAGVVRRLAVGERIDLTDGAGSVASCEVAEAGKDGLTCHVLARRTDPPPFPRFTVVQALPKGDRGELAVEMLTEIGVDQVVPWAASRCVTRWRGERADKSLAKWRSAAREAAKQSRRSWFPSVAPVASTSEVASLLGRSAMPIVLHEAADTAVAAVTMPPAGDVVLIVGPEGGISDEELAVFAGAGAQPRRLGPSVLRTSTAGVAAVAALMSRTARWA